MTMTRADQISIVAERLDLKKKDVENVYNELFQLFVERLCAGEEVRIKDVGIFKVKKAKARQARNPRTGQVVAVPESFRPTFTCSKVLKDKVNQK